MRLQAAMFALFLLLLSVPLAYAIEDACDACNQVILKPTLQVQGTNISVQAYFMNFSYYNQLQHLAKQSDYQNPSQIGVTPDMVNLAFNANLSPLKNAPLFFKLDDYIFVDSSNNPICDSSNPANTNESGIAQCDISFYRNSSGQAASLKDLSRCTNVVITYEGHSNGVQYKPATATVIVCGDNNNALSQIGREIATQVDANKEACVPVFILLGILLAAMYYSGKNPLSLFDITVPRFPATRKFRMARTGVMIGFTEKALMGKRIMGLANKSLASLIAREITNQSGGKNLSVKERKDIAKKVNEVLNGKGSQKEKYAALEAFVRGKFTDSKKADTAMRAVHQLLTLYLIADEDAKKSSFARGGRPADYKEATEEYKNLVGSGPTVRGSKWGKHITEFMSGNHKYNTKVNFFKIPLIKQTVGNAAIATAQNLNVWAAVRRIRREAIGSAVGNTARKVFRLNEHAPIIGGVIKKYNPEDKKFSTFSDEVYRLARDAAAAHDELKRERLLFALQEMFPAADSHAMMAILFAHDPQKGTWSLTKDAKTRFEALSEDDKKQLLGALKNIVEHKPDAHDAYYIEQLRKVSEISKKLGGKGLDEAALNRFAASFAEINVLGKDLFIEKDGKMIRIIESEEHLKNLAPKTAKDAMEAVIKYIELHEIRNPDAVGHTTMLGASMPLRLLEKMAYDSETGNAALRTSAQTWLLNFMNEHLAGATTAGKRDTLLQRLRAGVDGETFKRAMHELFDLPLLDKDGNHVTRTVIGKDGKEITENVKLFEGLKKRLSELDHWDLRNSYEHFRGETERKGACEALIALQQRIEREVVSRHFVNTLLNGETSFKSPLDRGDRFNPMRMAFERLFGRQESKFSFKEEYSFWSINRMQGRVETVDAANLYGYFHRSSDRNLSQLEWLTNWWLVGTKEGKERLKKELSGNANNVEMTATEYRTLMERGVLYKDIKKGLWMSSSDFQANPMALLGIESLRKAGAKFNSKGDVEFNNDALAQEWKKAWKDAYMPKLSISERFLNQYMLQNKKTNEHEPDLWERLGSGPKASATLQALAGHGKTTRDTRQSDRYGKQATEENLRRMQDQHMLVARDMFVSSNEFKGRKDLGRIFGEKTRERFHASVGSYFEDVAFGAAYYNTVRLQNWFESQTRMRTALQDFNRALAREEEDNELKSEKQKEYDRKKKEYKGALDAYNQNPNSTARASRDKAEQEYNSATKAWRKSGVELESDRHLFLLNKQVGDYMQVSERASMRDPRVAHSGIGINQPFGAGYHTGQQMYEPVESVFSFGILPDQDLVHRLTYRFAYRTNYEFVTRSRGMFGMIAMYPVRSDINEGAPVAQQYSFSEAFRSAFKVGMNDWFAVRWNAPHIRDFSEGHRNPLQYRSIFGIGTRESSDMRENYTFPVTMMNPGATDEQKEAFRLRMLKKGWTNKKIDSYFNREEYALSETYERRIKRLMTPVVNEQGEVTDYTYKTPWHANIPILKDLLGQGYYSAIKRTGDAYTAHGESMRDYEFYSPIYRNMSKAFPPGMMYEDWAGSRYHLMPRLATYALNFYSAQEDSATGDTKRHYLNRNEGTLGMSMPKKGGGSESYSTMLRRDANADVWVTTTHALALAAEREHEAIQFSPLHFSATIFALSPGLGAINMGKNVIKGKIQRLQHPDEYPSFFTGVKDNLKSLVSKNYDENRVICANGHKHTRDTACPVCQSLAASGKMALAFKDQSYTPAKVNKQLISGMNELKDAQAEVIRKYGSYLNS